eukprot:c7082_g1_i2.p3 GENE.c7082_g1_i2~~c7082_g1_i2.p3  ORF type:complete len:133 (+),score=44.66 c7082_g1_i2:43-399(+)
MDEESEPKNLTLAEYLAFLEAPQDSAISSTAEGNADEDEEEEEMADDDDEDDDDDDDMQQEDAHLEEVVAEVIEKFQREHKRAPSTAEIRELLQEIYDSDDQVEDEQAEDDQEKGEED